MRTSVSKPASLLSAALLFSAIALVCVQAHAQVTAPACTGKNCKQKSQAQRTAVQVNAAPGDLAPAAPPAGKRPAVQVNAAPGDQPGTKKKSAVRVNGAPAGDQPGVHRTSNGAKGTAAESILVETKHKNGTACVGTGCPSVEVNSADGKKK